MAAAGALAFAIARSALPLAAGVPPAETPDRALQLRFLTDVDPLALCGDGSPSGYYWGEGDPDSALWIVDLQGGGWCYSEESCKQRCPNGTANHLCTSKAWNHTQTQLQGLLNPAVHSLLSGAHRAFVPYCTSDGHMGDAEAFGMQFRGARVLRAVFADLVQRGGLQQGAQRSRGRPLVLLAGQSAGGRGAMVHLDYVREMLGSTLAQRVDVMGLLDSPLWIDLPPFSDQFIGFAAQCQGVFSYAGVMHLGPTCESEYDESSRWKCIMGEYRLPHVRTPYLLVASQYDAFQLGQNGISQPLTVEEHSYASLFAQRTRSLVLKLRAGWPASTLAPAQNAVFSWTCHEHATSLRRSGFDEHTCGSNSTSLDSATLQFLGLERVAGGPNGRALEWIDYCDTFNCGAGCKRQLSPCQAMEPCAMELDIYTQDDPFLV